LRGKGSRGQAGGKQNGKEARGQGTISPLAILPMLKKASDKADAKQ